MATVRIIIRCSHCGYGLNPTLHNKSGLTMTVGRLRFLNLEITLDAYMADA